MDLTFLGTGTSQGVPLLTCTCRVCTSPDPRDRRFRSSVWLHDKDLSIVIDTSPDFRSQALRASIPKLDAVLYTHSHADHIAGFDDLRTYSVKNGNCIPIYADPFTLSRLEKAFDYAFDLKVRSPAYVCPEPHPITGPFSIGSATFTPLPVPHGSISTTGFRIDIAGQPRAAYLPDCAAVPTPIRDQIRHIPILIIDGLREEPHPTHLTIAQAIEISQDIRAGQTWLTHLTHQTLHAERDASLPPLSASPTIPFASLCNLPLPTALALTSKHVSASFFSTLLALSQLGMAETPTPANSQGPDLAAHTVVVYNKADPDSQSLAETYAKARSIPPDRLLGIDCPITEEITRVEFETKIRQPLDEIFVARGWLKRSETILPNPILGLAENLPVQQSQENPIWIMVLMRGVPLKIAEDPTVLAPESLMAQLRANAAAVDSELALLPLRGLPTYGLVSNPYFADKRIRPFGQFFANYLILVCRLDGPTPNIVRRMIQDAVDTEKTELTGRAFFDIRTIEKKDDPYRMGDDWIEQAALLFQARGFDIEIDRKPEVASKWTPWDQVAFYAGWYTWNFEGPFELPTTRFRKGAIAYHIHSFSADTVRSETKNWVGPLLSHGVTATMGAVYEPYLRFTPDISLFVSGLLSGLTFAESAYQSQIALSWMVTFVGDPLYRPFPRNFYENLDAAQTSKSSNLPWLRLRKARLLANTGSISETRTAVNQLLEEFPKNKIILEGSADIYRDLNEKKDATQLYEEDLDLLDEKDSKDRFRILMKLAEIFRRDDKTKSAIDTYEKIAQEFPEATKGTGLGDRALSFASGEGISELPPALLAYKNAVEAEQLAAAVAKAAAQPPANLKPEATAADQAAVLKAAGPRPSLKDSSAPPLPPQPPGTKTNSPSSP